MRLLGACVAFAVALTVLVAPGTPASAASTTAAAPPPANMLHVGSGLPAGAHIVSQNGAYTAGVAPWGQLILRHRGEVVWATRTSGAQPRLVLRQYGDLVLMAGSRLLWHTNTAMSYATALVVTNLGSLELRSAGGTVWSYRLGNPCGAGGATGKRIYIGLGHQFARLCENSQQVLTTPITSGASAYGDGTPTGTWYLQGKQRDRYLYPAAGGAYYVHFWMPYNGDYGMHDSSWQHFPYGSSLYRTQGSHGCVHFPYAAIAWMYSWASIGTLVHIQA